MLQFCTFRPQAQTGPLLTRALAYAHGLIADGGLFRLDSPDFFNCSKLCLKWSNLSLNPSLLKISGDVNMPPVFCVEHDDRIVIATRWHMRSDLLAG